MIDYRLLGPLEVACDGRALDLGGRKQRILLTSLLLHANQPVRRDVLIDHIWGEHPPAGPDHAVDVYIWRLRKRLDPAAGSPCVLTQPGGYVLEVTQEQVDTARFERLAEEARCLLVAGVADRAAEGFREALALWRGAPLADFRNEPFAQAEIARLEQQRTEVVEDRIDADLALGRHIALISESEALVAAEPLRERPYRQLMIALYRSGRQADALAVYQRARRTLVDELGIEPGQPLRQTERAILRQDPSLEPPSPEVAAPEPAAGTGTAPVPPVRPFRRRRLLAAGAALVVTLALVVATTTHGSARLAALPDSVGAIDGAQGNLSAVVTKVGRPNGIAYGAGAVWVTDSADNLLLRVDPAGQVVDRIPVGRGPAGVTVGDGEVWVANELDGTLSEVNPGSGTQVAMIPVGVGPSAVGFGYGSVWVANVTSDTLSRIEAATGDVTATIPLDSSPGEIAVGAGAVWVTSQQTGELLRVDPVDGRPSQAIAIGQSPDAVAVGAGSVWVADADGTAARFDPQTGRVRTIRVGGTPAGITYADGAVWVANGVSGTVARIQPGTGAERIIRVGNEPADLAAAGHHVWATVLPSLASHRGGTLTVVAQRQDLYVPASTWPEVLHRGPDQGGGLPPGHPAGLHDRQEAGKPGHPALLRRDRRGQPV